MKSVGARLPRYDGLAHVTGRTQFVDDVRIGKTLVVKALRSPHHHAAITSLDTSKAESLKGVRAIVTHGTSRRTSTAISRGSASPPTSRCSRTDDVRYKGQPIAVVAAETEEAALAAIDAIEIAYEERPAQFDMRLGLDPEAPQIHQWGNVYPHYGPYNHRRVRKGDIDRAFDEADTIVEGVYRPQAIEQMPLETQVAIAVPEASGRLTIYSCTQAMYFSMGVVAAHLQWPLNKLKFVGGTVGGGFGGKVDTATETLCALLALKAKRPVKWRWTREEEFLVSSTRAPWHMEIADAVSKDGWILGRRMSTLHDAGAYARFSPYGVTKHAFHHSRRLHDPEPPLRRLRLLHEPRADDRDARLRRHVGVVRGRDAPEPDRAGDGARPVGAAPEEREPDRRHDRQRRRAQGSLDGAGDARGGRARGRRARRRVPDDDLGAARGRDAAAEHLEAQQRLSGEEELMAVKKGRGFATIEYPTGMNQNGDPSQAWIKLKPDGRVDVFSGTVDVGQGSKTVHTQIVAETLGVPYDWVTMDNTNTDSSAVCTGHVRLARHVHRRQRGAPRRGAGAGADPRHRVEGARDRPAGPDDRGRRGGREGRAAEEDRRRRTSPARRPTATAS